MRSMNFDLELFWWASLRNLRLMPSSANGLRILNRWLGFSEKQKRTPPQKHTPNRAQKKIPPPPQTINHGHTKRFFPPPPPPPKKKKKSTGTQKDSPPPPPRKKKKEKEKGAPFTSTTESPSSPAGCQKNTSGGPGPARDVSGLPRGERLLRQQRALHGGDKNETRHEEREAKRDIFLIEDDFRERKMCFLFLLVSKRILGGLSKCRKIMGSTMGFGNRDSQVGMNPGHLQLDLCLFEAKGAPFGGVYSSHRSDQMVVPILEASLPCPRCSRPGIDASRLRFDAPKVSALGICLYLLVR